MKADLNDFLSCHKFVYTKAFRRKVFLDKLPEVIIQRKSSAKKRLACFGVAMDILRQTRKSSQNLKNTSEYSLEGISQEGFLVEVHLREEIDKRDRKLYFVSCFY